MTTFFSATGCAAHDNQTSKDMNKVKNASTSVTPVGNIKFKKYCCRHFDQVSINLHTFKLLGFKESIY
jgi:hypothetical protein